MSFFPSGITTSLTSGLPSRLTWTQGPRPPLPSEVERYDAQLRRRLNVKPGITGLWQVSGRHQLSFEDYVRFDLLYVQNWSVALDLMVIWKTMGAVLHGRGAY